MATHKITGSQLRGLIKEALDETVEEIALDDERMELARLGNRRTPAQNRRYVALLEAKRKFMNEAEESPAVKATSLAGKVEAKMEQSTAISGLIDNLRTSKDLASLFAQIIESAIEKQKAGENITVKGFMSQLNSMLPKLKAREAELITKRKEEKPVVPGFESATKAEKNLRGFGGMVTENRRLIRRR